MAISILRLQFSFYTIYTALPTPDSATRQLRFCYNIRQQESVQCHNGRLHSSQLQRGRGSRALRAAHRRDRPVFEPDALAAARQRACRRYAVEVKTAKNFKGEDSYTQLAGYLDKLGLPEGWMAVFDEDKTKLWEEKLFARKVEFNGKTLHISGL